MKKFFAIVLTIILLFSMVLKPTGQEVQAASNYITIKAFINSLVVRLDLPINQNFDEPYIMAAADAKLLIGGDFSGDLAGHLTRTDAAVLLNNVDEYLHGGNIVEAKLLEVILNKRISDIKKVDSGKREAVAKCFAKGIIKGFGNGEYSQDREFRGSQKVTESTAKELIDLVFNPSKRAKISPDGQLIRTTNLPKYAEYYPYILASFPNAYYDWKFDYEGQVKRDPETNEVTPYKNIVEYAAPVDIDKIKDFDNFKEVKEEYLDLWVDKVQTYMGCVFNADYRTIDDEWVNKVLSTDYGYNDENKRNNTKKDILKYVSDMKKNKTIVESSQIAVDGSSLYFYKGSYYLRTYVKYRINSSNIKPGADADTLIYENPYGKILYTNASPVCLSNFKNGQWKEGYFDVEMGWVYRKEPNNIGIYEVVFDELWYEKRRVDK
jgi:hypothetical protein